MRELQEQAERIRRLTAEPEAIRRMRELQEQAERIRRLTAEPEAIRRMRELQEQAERMNQLISEPQVVARMRHLQERAEHSDRLMSPLGLDDLTNQLQGLTQADVVTRLDLGTHRAEAEPALASLRDATSAWVADAHTEPMDASAEVPATDFGWVELLPTITQLKLLNATMDVLNAMLLLVACVAPSSAPPMPLLLTIEVLIRLARMLFQRLDAQ
jgi:hypothetical protein